jgi:hypothetical protein
VIAAAPKYDQKYRFNIRTKIMEVDPVTGAPLSEAAGTAEVPAAFQKVFQAISEGFTTDIIFDAIRDAEDEG